MMRVDGEESGGAIRRFSISAAVELLSFQSLTSNSFK